MVSGPKVGKGRATLLAQGEGSGEIALSRRATVASRPLRSARRAKARARLRARGKGYEKKYSDSRT